MDEPFQTMKLPAVDSGSRGVDASPFRLPRKRNQLEVTDLQSGDDLVVSACPGSRPRSPTNHSIIGSHKKKRAPVDQPAGSMNHSKHTMSPWSRDNIIMEGTLQSHGKEWRNEQNPSSAARKRVVSHNSGNQKSTTSFTGSFESHRLAPPLFRPVFTPPPRGYSTISLSETDNIEKTTNRGPFPPIWTQPRSLSKEAESTEKSINRGRFPSSSTLSHGSSKSTSIINDLEDPDTLFVTPEPERVFWKRRNPQDMDTNISVDGHSSDEEMAAFRRTFQPRQPTRQTSSSRQHARIEIPSRSSPFRPPRLPFFSPVPKFQPPQPPTPSVREREPEPEPSLSQPLDAVLPTKQGPQTLLTAINDLPEILNGLHDRYMQTTTALANKVNTLVERVQTLEDTNSDLREKVDALAKGSKVAIGDLFGNQAEVLRACDEVLTERYGDVPGGAFGGPNMTRPRELGVFHGLTKGNHDRGQRR